MTAVRDQLDEIEQAAKLAKAEMPTRRILLDWMSAELGELSFKIQADYFYVHLDPVLSLTTGQRAYKLPENFPDNFVRHAGERFYAPLNLGGDKWCCKLDDGTSEALLSYESPSQFFSKNLRAESNNRPSVYTILSTPVGKRQLLVSPPPDANGTAGYTIDGLYLPTDWKLSEYSSTPPLPANSAVLKYAVLRRLAPQIYEAKYAEARADVILKAAQNRVAQFVPVLGRSGQNEYTAQRRRI